MKTASRTDTLQRLTAITGALRWLLVLALLILPLAGCQKDTWKEFSSTEGRFSVLMPGTPTERTLKVNTVAGVIDAYDFTLVVGGWGYNVNYNDFAAGEVEALGAEKLLDACRDGAVSGGQSELLSEFIISLDEYPGRDLRMAQADGQHTLRMRLYLVENRMYQVGVITPKEDSFSKDITKFFDSFKLLEE